MKCRRLDTTARRMKTVVGQTAICTAILFAACSNDTKVPPTPILASSPTALPTIVHPNGANPAVLGPSGPSTPSGPLPSGASAPVIASGPTAPKGPSVPTPSAPRPSGPSLTVAPKKPAEPKAEPKPEAKVAPEAPKPAVEDVNNTKAEGPVKFMDEKSKAAHEDSLDDMMGDSKAATKSVKDKQKAPK